jgi:hypothetical protein
MSETDILMPGLPISGQPLSDISAAHAKNRTAHRPPSDPAAVCRALRYATSGLFIVSVQKLHLSKTIRNIDLENLSGKSVQNQA